MYFQKTEIINLGKQITHLVHDEIKYMKYFYQYKFHQWRVLKFIIYEMKFSQKAILVLLRLHTHHSYCNIYNDTEAIMAMFYILWNNWNTLKLILWLKWIGMPENSGKMLFPNIRIEKPSVHYSHFAMCLQLI